MELEQSDQEQVEALQKWWRENWMSLVGGLVIGLGGILGWQYYGQYQADQASNASQAYEAIKTKLVSDKLDEAQADIAALQAAHGKSPYVAQADLALAQAQADAGNWSGAETSLRSVVDGNADEPVKALARLRLAKVLWAQDKSDAALQLLDQASDNGFTPLYAELKGDIAVSKGDSEAARLAYQSALESPAGYVDQNAIQQKLDALK